MQNVETTYILRLFDPKRDRDAIVEAVSLYSQNTPSYERTPSNEILYWFERYNLEFEDRLMLFGFYRNTILIGFAEIVWFHEEKLIILDYMTIHEQYRRNNTFFEFLDQIKYFLEATNLEFDFIVTEIPYSSHNEAPTEASHIWIQLLRLHGFGLVHAKYQQPQLGRYNLESIMPGALMVYTKGGLRPIRKESYLVMVDVILFKHYLRWYKPFHGDKLSRYESSLKKIRSSILSSIDTTHIEVNGAARTLPTTSIPARSRVDFKSFVLPSVLIVTCYMLVLALVGYVFKLPITIVGLLVFLSLLTFFSILAVVSKPAMQVLDRILRLIKRTYDTKK
jgi:hypothetical protein